MNPTAVAAEKSPKTFVQIISHRFTAERSWKISEPLLVSQRSTKSYFSAQGSGAGGQGDCMTAERE